LKPLEFKNLEITKKSKLEVETEKGDSENYTTTLENEDIIIQLKSPKELEELERGMKVNIRISTEQKTIDEQLKDINEEK